MSKRLSRLILLAVVFLLTNPAFAASLRGRLDRAYSKGTKRPAVGLAVTIYNRATGRSYPAYSGADGIYHMQNISAGRYYLEIWVSRDPRTKPLVFQIQIVEPNTDLAPIVAP